MCGVLTSSLAPGPLQHGDLRLYVSVEVAKLVYMFIRTQAPEDTFIRFDRIHERDRQTDSWTPHGATGIASRGKKRNFSTDSSHSRLLELPPPDCLHGLLDWIRHAHRFLLQFISSLGLFFVCYLSWSAATCHLGLKHIMYATLRY